MLWRHTPKIVVLAAIGFLVLFYYVTQQTSEPTPASAGKDPGVIYINPGFGSGSR